MLAKLVCQYNKNLRRVFTEKSTKTLSGHKLNSNVEIVSKKTKTLANGSIQLDLTFGNGKVVRVTYEDLV